MVWQDVKNLEARYNGLFAAVEALRDLIGSYASASVDEKASVLKTVNKHLGAALAQAQQEPTP